jgi:hypothetical protein
MQHLINAKDPFKLDPYGPIHTVIQVLKTILIEVCAIRFERF